ncbi:PucR family transcriptional regulator ligand-binding domain-containing protein [Knoellia koreensis]|uniref:PucR family transcriptional regulator n=1 Tax=Knoellia koreensis TaxID=2730921 RepID=A0A849HBF5_9MICO|nr:PucR family transcriptional regulator [Knoellia sp. DB2414S]
MLLADLVRDPALHLDVVVPATTDDVRIVAAHVSELVRPQEWLQGGELLMTIGLLLEVTEDECDAYVRSVRDGGAAALALGLGHGLPHQEAPEPLVAAARRHGIPLLTVPDEVPFIAVTKAVFRALAAQEQAAMQHAVDLLRDLTRAATGTDPLTAMTRTWERGTGTTVFVLDRAGRSLDTTGSPPPSGIADLLAAVEQKGLHGSARDVTDRARVDVQPLGVDRLRGFVVVQTPVGDGAVGAEADPVAVAALVSLLSAELERRHLAGDAGRRARSALVGRALDAAPGAPVWGHLRDAGLRGESVRALVVDVTDLPEAAELAGDLALVASAGLVRHHGGELVVLADEGTDLAAVARRFAAGRPCGIGRPMPLDRLRDTVGQARAAMLVSRSTGEPVEHHDDPLDTLLATVSAPEAVRAYADTVLAPLERADADGTLLATLAAWLDAGSVDATASRLDVHRHTVRNRLQRIADLTGAQLDSAEGRLHLHLAVRLRGDLRDGRLGQS